MNRIGILTFHRTTNFGSSLQTYGLYKKIIDLGYNCQIIDYRCPAIEKRECLTPKYKLTNIRDIYIKFMVQPYYDRKAISLENFAKKNMELSNPIFPEDKCLLKNDYDKFIVGSDIVWGRDITEDDYTYFLDFIHDKSKKYAFSSSVGDCDVRKDETILSKLLNDFSQIAVREDEAVNWVKQIAGIDAKLVCDPTMLLTKEEWDNCISTKQLLKNYVFVYFDSNDNKCLNDAKRYAKKKGLKVAFVNYGKPILGVRNIKPTSSAEFLSYIKYASMVFTASYHGMLFSIYYNKEFLFYTRAHKSRVLSLARKLGVEDYCGDYWNGESYKQINYEKVNLRVLNFRKNSIEILKGMLSE